MQIYTEKRHLYCGLCCEAGGNRIAARGGGDMFYMGHGWAFPAGSKHRFDGGGITTENRLDGAIASVAYPAGKTACMGFAHGPGAIADALYAACHDHSHVLVHGVPPGAVAAARIW